MIQTLYHKVSNGFFLWAQDRISRVGNAVETGVSQSFSYKESFDIPSNYEAFYSDVRQFNFNGTGVPSGVYINGSIVYQNPSDATGMIIDFNQGRIIAKSGQISQAATISGNFDRMEINVYSTNEDEEAILVNKDFDIYGSEDSYLDEISSKGRVKATIPACFITNSYSENSPFALGGTEKTTYYMKMLVITDSEYTLNGIIDVFRDTRNILFPTVEDFPFGIHWHLKEPPYNYQTMASGLTKDCYIEDVKVSKLNNTLKRNLAMDDLKVGFVDFEISNVRTNVRQQ